MRQFDRLQSIEILRGIAACIVVFSHVARHVDRHTVSPALLTLFQPGHAGVDLFFVLSGFIILSVHRADIGQPARLRHYASRRFNRVLPLYWVALIVTLGLSIAGGHPAPSSLDLVWWASLLPTTIEPFFAIAWTLQYEAMFYVCFGLLILNRRLGMTLFAAWMIVITAFLGPDWPPALCRVFGLEFLFGLLAAQILHVRRIEFPVLTAGIGAASFAAVYGLEACGIMNGFGVLARFTYGIPAAITIIGLAASERAGRTLLPRWLEPLGRASYSIYLFQFIGIGAMWQSLRLTGLLDRLSGPVLFTLLTAGTLAGGIAVNVWLEQPLLRALRRPHRPIPSGSPIPLPP